MPDQDSVIKLKAIIFTNTITQKRQANRGTHGFKSLENFVKMYPSLLKLFSFISFYYTGLTNYCVRVFLKNRFHYARSLFLFSETFASEYFI